MQDPVRARYRRIVFLTWFLTLDLIMFGAFVRLTDPGLGCPDWPGCYGNVTPIGTLQNIHEAAKAMPEGPVTLPKAWIEMVHRYVGATLGFLIIITCWMAWRHRARFGQSPALAFVALIAVCVQGAFGAWTVTHQLMPVVVTGHLLGGVILLALMTWLAARETDHDPVPARAAWALPWVAIALALLFIQIALGGWVSTNYAALACMDFPTCNGVWLPDMDPASGFALIRGLGETPGGAMISQSALTAIHWVHRNFAFVVRVNKPGDMDLGELALSYWDPDDRVYGTARAPLGKVHVRAVPGKRAERGPELLEGLPSLRAQREIGRAHV